MRRTPTRPTVAISIAAIALVVSLNRVSTAPQAPAVTPKPQAADGQAQLATIKQYFVTCHNDRTKTGGVSFEGLTAESVGQHGDGFEKAGRKRRGGVLPPPGSRR